MLKRMVMIGFLLGILGFQAIAQNSDAEVVISGDLTTIYTIGNASDDQRIDTDPQTAGAFFNNPVTGTRKNGFYTAANLYSTLRPFPWLEGFFKIYAISRPGSFYMPLSMENLARQDFALTLDAVYGKASVFGMLNLDMPVDLILKAGKYKAQAAQYGVISKYKTEQLLYMMNTKTDFTYELDVTMESPFKLGFSAVTNYLLNESVQRHYDEDGGYGLHGDPVLNEYAPQFMIGVNLQDFNNVNAELIYGQNVSNIYSGHAVGFSARYLAGVNENISVPVGLTVAFYEKNIDMMGQAAVSEKAAASGNATTMSFRESFGAALGAGLRLEKDIFNFEFNLAGTFSSVKHYYRNDLSLLKLSADAMVTLLDNYFIGAGIIMGTLADAEWKTREDARDKDEYENTFTFAENLGYEIYAGINLISNGKFIIGFNQNKGLTLNNMLEAKHEGQMKYKQADSNWALDNLAEAGGLYFKFFFKF